MFSIVYIYFSNFNFNQQLAELGFSFAQYNLGRMYYEGDGVSQDYKKAAEWYNKAAIQGNSYAQT